LKTITLQGSVTTFGCGEMCFMCIIIFLLFCKFTAQCNSEKNYKIHQIFVKDTNKNLELIFGHSVWLTCVYKHQKCIEN